MSDKLKSTPLCPVDAQQPFAVSNKITGTLEVLQTPVKSSSNKKDYKVIRLPNGLTACLISDMPDANNVAKSISEIEPKIDCERSGDAHEVEEKIKEDKPKVKLAAAALCVGVGGLSDPKEVPGLAHFIEHMVFMGSEKFPAENDFNSFITKHGGSHNALTSYEATTFYFECFEKYLHESLDKLSQFFIAPLMKKDSMMREREAIESEFQLALPSDYCATQQLFIGLALESSSINSFTWGNLLTLKGNVEDDTLYRYLHEFRKRHYSAHRMTLAVQARLPLETLERYVVDFWSSVPNNNLPAINLKEFTKEIFESPRLNKIYYVNPVKDICELNLTWIMPKLTNMYKRKPLKYILWLLEHEAKGSVLSYLKEKVWALALQGACDEITSSIYASFMVSITLTTEGLDHLNEIIETVFRYLKMLKNEGPSERIFNELQLIQNATFRFEHEEDAISGVKSLSESMQFLPPEDYLTGNTIFFEYEPETITEMLNCLTPEKLNVMVLSKKFSSEIVFDKIERWFKTAYTEQDIPVDWMKSWQIVEPLPCFTLPEPNTFITEDFALLPLDENIPDYPEKILDSPLVELWYRKDQKFKLPMADYCYYFITPLALKSAESLCMLDQFVNLLRLALAEEGYHAAIANISYSISCCDRGFTIMISGYNEKIPLLMELIANTMKAVGDNLQKKVFEAILEKQSQDFYNQLLEPATVCWDNFFSILRVEHISLLEKCEAIKKITFESMVNFSKTLLDDFYVQALIQGNVSSSTAIDATNAFLTILNCSPLTVENYPIIHVNIIPDGEYCVRVQSVDEQSSNSVIMNYYQTGLMTLNDKVILEVVMYLLEEPLFDVLRTKEQLGYSVYNYLYETFDVLGYSICVKSQANKFTTDYVDSRIEAFLENQYQSLKDLSSEKFLQAKARLVLLKHAVDVDLGNEVSRNWDEIVNKRYIFDRPLREIAFLENLQMEDVIKWWYKQNVFNKENTFKKLSSQVVGHCVNGKRDECDSSGENRAEVVKKVKAKKVKLCFLENLEEIKIKNRNENYFIKDIGEFKNKLQPYNTLE